MQGETIERTEAKREFYCTVPLRWSDQDINGHVNNARVVTLMEEARVGWLNRDAAEAGITSFDCPKVVVSLNVGYKKPVNFGHELRFVLSVARIGRTSFCIRYEASQQGEVVFQGETVLVTLDPDGMTPRPLSTVETTYLSLYLSESGSQ